MKSGPGLKKSPLPHQLREKSPGTTDRDIMRLAGALLEVTVRARHPFSSRLRGAGDPTGPRRSLQAARAPADIFVGPVPGDKISQILFANGCVCYPAVVRCRMLWTLLHIAGSDLLVP